jgi:hypothetical protein
MKTNMQQLATSMSMLILLVATTADARPIVLPATVGSGQSGTFTVTADNQIILTGNPVSLMTSLPSNGDVANGTARFVGGTLQYADGSTTVDGKMARVILDSQIKNGQVSYIIKGLVYGKLTQSGNVVDVNGDFSASTKPAPEGTPLELARVDFSHLLLTIHSKYNNTQVQ